MRGHEKPETPRKSPPRRLWLQQQWRSATAGIVGALLVTLVANTAPLRWLELKTQDIRFRVRGTRASHTRVVIAAIEDSTLKRWPEPTTFWGGHFAEAINGAHSHGASLIGLDFILNVDVDNYLLTRWKIAGPNLPNQQLGLALLRAPVVLSNTGVLFGTPVDPIPQIALLPTTADNIGFVDAPYDPLDHVWRAERLSVRSGARLFPSFPTALALALRGERADDPAAIQALAHSVGARAVDGMVPINTVGPPGHFPSVPIERLAEGRLTRAEQEQFRNAVVIIAPRFTGSNDLHPGAGFESYYGAEVVANELATLLDRRPLRLAVPFRTIMCAAGLGLLIAVGAAVLPALGSALLLILAAGGWWLLAVALFRGDTVLPVAAPTFAALAGWAAHQGYRSWEEANRRVQIEKILRRQVSGAVADELLKRPDRTNLAGELRNLTVLFSDIRGFTSLSEKMKPEEVVATLSEYLSLMTECIFRHEGVMDKYIGDAVMAFWNAPQDQPDHAVRAIATAVDMITALEGLNRKWEAQGLSPLRIGIGINTGPMVVGHLGEYGNYTVIGDAVNMGSRLEGLNKELSTTVLLGEETYRLAGTRIRTRGPLQVMVKGKADPQPVYVLEEFDGQSLPGG